MIILSYLAVFANNWIFASSTKIHFDPFKWHFNDIRDYMDVQSIFGLFLQLNWKETTFVTSWTFFYVKMSSNIPLLIKIEKRRKRDKIRKFYFFVFFTKVFGVNLPTVFFPAILAFQSFNIEHTWRGLLQNHIVCFILDI